MRHAGSKRSIPARRRAYTLNEGIEIGTKEPRRARVVADNFDLSPGNHSIEGPWWKSQVGGSAATVEHIER